MRHQGTYFIIVETDESLKDLRDNWSPCSDVFNLVIDAKFDEIAEDTQSQSVKRRVGELTKDQQQLHVRE